MKEYTRTKKIKAIQWTGENKKEIKVALGNTYYMHEHWDNSLFINKRGVREFKEIDNNGAWIVMDSSDVCGISVVSNEDFQKEFVEAEK